MKCAKRILIADDDEDLVDVLARHFQELDFHVERAHDGLDALAKIDTHKLDLLILDVNMPFGTGLSVCEMAARDPHLKAIPVIVLTGKKNQETIRVCQELQAHYVPKGTDMLFRLVPLVSELLSLGLHQPASRASAHVAEIRRADLGHAIIAPPVNPAADAPPSPPEPVVAQPAKPATMERRPENESIDRIFAAMGWSPTDCDPLLDPIPCREITRPWVLCIDDDADFANLLKLRLEQHGVEVLQAFAGMAGYRNAFSNDAQAIILDYELPDGNGDYVLRRLKENPVTKEIPVIVLTGRREMAIERKMYNLGATRFLTKPIEWNELRDELLQHIPLIPITTDAK